MEDSELQQFVEQIQKLFPLIMRYLEDEASRELIGLEVTPSQMNALFALYGMDDLPMGELAEQMGLTESAATRLVDRLINMNLVRRDRDEQDRRVVRVRLSTYGRQLAELVFERRQQQFTRFAERLEQPAREALLYGLSHLLKVFQLLEQECKSQKT
jgi:DNA-binding MarR family transcriptional regulator